MIADLAHDAVGDWMPRDVLAPWLMDDLRHRIEMAINDEREACAKFVELFVGKDMSDNAVLAAIIRTGGHR